MLQFGQHSEIFICDIITAQSLGATGQPGAGAESCVYPKFGHSVYLCGITLVGIKSGRTVA
jgi:hypothetical protein